MPAAIDQIRELEDFDAIVRLYWSRVFRFALASVRDHDSAQTISQDCFFKAFKSRTSFRGEAAISTWLMQIAVNLVRDHARNRRLMFWKRAVPAAEARDFPDTGTSPEAGAQNRQQVAAVWAAARELPEKQKTVFLLRFVEDMELLEIAAVTGLSEGTVKTHLHRAVQSIRRRLGGMK